MPCHYLQYNYPTMGFNNSSFINSYKERERSDFERDAANHTGYCTKNCLSNFTYFNTDAREKIKN